MPPIQPSPQFSGPIVPSSTPLPSWLCGFQLELIDDNVGPHHAGLIAFTAAISGTRTPTALVAHVAAATFVVRTGDIRNGRARAYTGNASPLDSAPGFDPPGWTAVVNGKDCTDIGVLNTRDAVDVKRLEEPPYQGMRGNATVCPPQRGGI